MRALVAALVVSASFYFAAAGLPIPKGSPYPPTHHYASWDEGWYAADDGRNGEVGSIFYPSYSRYCDEAHPCHFSLRLHHSIKIPLGLGSGRHSFRYDVELW